MSLRRWSILLLVVLGCRFSVLAQGFRRTDPVQVSTSVLQASRHLSDYTDGMADNIQVTLVNRNQDGMPLRIALRLAIETANLSITTRPEAVLPVFDLDPGATLVLREADLAPYFLKNNLRLQGVMKNSDLLPDGLARFSFQAVEFYSGTAVSQPGSTLAPLARATLPRLVAPAQNESITYRTAGNPILFTWTPASYAGAQLRYEFHLVQLDDPYTAPEQAVNAPGLLRMSYPTPATSFKLLPSSDFTLQPGRTYAWYVRAAEVHDGTERSDAFQNNGYSEVRTFRVVEDCKAPSGIRVQTDKWTRSATLSWDKAANHSAFAVAYIGEERQNDDYSLWVEDHTQACSKTIANLKAGASYRFRVGAACQSDGSFVYTQPQTFTIPVLTEEDNAQCGQMPQRVVDDGLRLEALEPGDVVTIAGGFPMTVTAVNSPSPFNGEGYISTRLTGPVKIAVLFKNLTVNPDYRMTGGTVESAYDANGGLVYSLNRLNQGGVTQLKDGRILPDWELDFVIDPNCRLSVDTTASPASMTFYNATGQVLGTVRMGTDVAPVFPMTVKDADGNLFEIEEETDGAGLPTGEYAFKPLGRFGGRLGPGDYVANAVNGEVAVVSFLAHPDARYTFDPFLKWYDDVLLLSHYGIYGNERAYARLAIKGGGGYDVPWVFLPEGASDKVYATLEVNKDFKGDFDPAKVVFKTDEGYIAASEYDPQAKRYTVSVAAAQPGSRQMLHALYPMEGTQMYHLGRLDIDTRTETSHTVCLVPMGGSYDRAAIERELNRIYGRIGIAWEVQELTGFAPDKTLTEGLFDKESSKLTSYNDQKQALNKELRRWLDDRYDANTAYVFLFDDATGDSGKESAGFMPLGCQFAYINCAKAGDVARTVAHELGHGCFLLRHPFDDAYGSSNTSARKNTDLLMDYNSGDHLPKWQWDMVYNPAVFKPLVKEEEDGEWREQYSIRWLGDWLQGFAPDKLEKSIENDLTIYNDVATNFEKYFEESKSKDVETTSSWSARKAAHSSHICKKIFEKISQNTNPELSMYEKGVYTEKYTLEETEYKIAILSYQEKASILTKNIRLESYSKFADCKYVKAGYTKLNGGYGIIVFFDGDKPLFTIQVIDSDPQMAVEKWINYLALILPSEKQKEEDGEKVSGFSIHPLDKLVEIWNNFNNWLNDKEFDKLEQTTELTPSEIKDYRDIIKTLPEDEQAKWYLELQKKVPYHNQRDNESPATEEDIEANKWLEGKTAGDIMCNLTSEAMCLEMLGIEFPCEGCSSDCDEYDQFEDYLECLRLSNGYEHRGTSMARGKLSTLVNANQTCVNISSNNKTIISEKLENALMKGYSVLISAFGHIVRLQAITKDGLIVDDPYGKVCDFSHTGCTQKYKCSEDYRNGDNLGNDNLWKWTDLKTNNIIINYAEIYSPND